MAVMQLDESERPPKWRAYTLRRVPDRERTGADTPSELRKSQSRAVVQGTEQRRGIELVCRRCSRRPRLRLRRLYQLSEEAAAQGRSIIYV